DGGEGGRGAGCPANRGGESDSAPSDREDQEEVDAGAGGARQDDLGHASAQVHCDRHIPDVRGEVQGPRGRLVDDDRAALKPDRIRVVRRAGARQAQARARLKRAPAGLSWAVATGHVYSCSSSESGRVAGVSVTWTVSPLASSVTVRWSSFWFWFRARAFSVASSGICAPGMRSWMLR